MHIDRRGADDPDVRRLVGAALAELRVRYPGDDDLDADPIAATSDHFVAYVDEKAAGCVILVSVGPDLGEVKRLFVDSDFRGRGLARNLMAEVEKRARELEMSTIRLETGTRQPEAISLYEALGYEPIPGFGRYRDSPLSRCFAKTLDSTGGALGSGG